MRKFIYFSRIKSLIATYVGAFGNNKRPRLPLKGNDHLDPRLYLSRIGEFENFLEDEKSKKYWLSPILS